MPSDSEQRFAVGVNGGATHTQFVLIDNDLNTLGHLTAGSTNFRNIGFDAVCHTLKTGISQVIVQAGLSTDKIAAIGLGLAGADNDVAQQNFQQALGKAFPGKPISFDNDAIVALIGGTGRALGIIAISGTGSIVIGVDGQGHRARAGGWGYHLDRGSGYAIGRGALTAITLAHDGLGPATALTASILDHLGLSEVHQLVDWLYAPERRTDEIAALAVDTVAVAENDSVAAGLIRGAAEALADSVNVVAQKLDLRKQSFPLLTSGSLFEHSALMKAFFMTAVQSKSPGAVAVTALHDAAVGAAMMAVHNLDDSANAPEVQ